MNSKRLFSHNNEINFNDYLKNKKGVEILKNIKSKNDNKISNFFNYDYFITLTKSYFKFCNRTIQNISVPVNIYNSNTSFIYYQNTLIHIRNCEYCNYCTDITQLYGCNALQNILYPYGNYIKNSINNINNNNIYLHSRFNLDDWCNKKTENVNTKIPNFFDGNLKIPLNEDAKCRSCSKTVISKKDDCSFCSIKDELSKKILETENFHMFPSQNKFIIQKLTDTDKYEESYCTNAYSMYPKINISNKPEIKPSSLCKKTSPLFI